VAEPVDDVAEEHEEEEPDPIVADPEPAEPVALPEAATRPGQGSQLEMKLGPTVGDWRLPPAKLLKRAKPQAIDEREVDAGGVALVTALAAHGVETRLVGRTVGPSVTRYELELGAGVKVARVTSLSKDIAYAMASPDVRILAPIPGKSAIGVEVPNRNRQLVALGDILASPEAANAHHPLEVALGRDIAGRAVMVNLAEMPHVLVSGATGSGKSSCINSVLTSILTRATPDQVRLILVDPKRVELGQYNDLPHLLTQVVVDPKKAANALNWAVTEMERRYDLLAEVGMRDITGYNNGFDHGDLASFEEAYQLRMRGAGLDDDDLGDGEGDEPEPRFQRLPFILIVVDELNDLMMVAARDVEESVCRIAQMARAVGIHLVLATQRPSVDVITGVIKANIPSRMAFSVSSLADSRVILDQPGAERLIGKGDMLLLSASSSNPQRLQGPWVSEDEVRAVTAHWKRQRPMEVVSAIEEVVGSEGPRSGGEDGDDELLEQAMELVVRSQLGSTSMLQRKLRVWFARAGRLMDLMERRGVVGPSEGSKARAVLMTPEELDAR
jgi:S-DNA-T family DNA segregation ATPase FtsK/SpoIIIE